MQRLAEFVLRGPVYAAGVAVIAMAVPFLFWISAAVVGLVTLRLGLRQGLSIGIWALLPGAAWLLWGMDPAPLAVLLLTMVMSAILQATVSWEKTLIGGAAAAIAVAHAIPLVAPDFFGQVTGMAEQVYSEMDSGATANLPEGQDPASVIRMMMIATLGLLNYGLAVLSTLLARGWQAKLFNPGGLKSEFHEFRLSAPVALAVLVVLAVGDYVGLNPTLLLLVLGLPLFMAGIALVHGVVAKRELAGGWLIGFYIALIILTPWLFLVLMIAAIIDSWFDIRQRL
jgi:hypothetical protein